MRFLKLAFTIISFLIIAALGYKTLTVAKTNQILKHDIAELNHFKYGLFSIDSWKKQLSVIVADEINDLSLTPASEKTIKKTLETQLGVLFDKVMERIEKSHSGTTEGKIKLTLMDSFVDIKEIKKGIPGYANAMLKELRSRKSEKSMKSLLKEKIDDYMAGTFDAKPDPSKTKIIALYKMPSEEAARSYLKETIDNNNDYLTWWSLIMIAFALLMFVVEGFNKESVEQTQYILMSLTLLILLVCGVATPMIDMEAKITDLSFMLFNHPVSFKDQVLYFQSKSILDVFNVMITHKEVQMKLVGILVVSFSVIFPIFKMLSSLAYYYDYCGARQYKIVQFFVLKSGKWSMSDVLVVAIFMAYIGFNGIINSQLENLHTAGEALNVMSTNGTSLQPGFFLFFSYALLAMFLSSYLHARPYQCKTVEEVVPLKNASVEDLDNLDPAPIAKPDENSQANI